jgi:hypothetical protein
MRRMFLLLAFAIGSVSAFDAMAASAGLKPATYVFGNYVLDLSTHSEQWHPQYRFPVTDCSTPELFCLTAKPSADSLALINLAWPKTCAPLKIGDTWRVGDVETRVYGKKTNLSLGMPSPHSDDFGDTYYIASPQYPKTIYEYSQERGIVAIYDALKGDGVSKGAPLEERALSTALKLPRVTFVPLGPCVS